MSKLFKDWLDEEPSLNKEYKSMMKSDRLKFQMDWNSKVMRGYQEEYVSSEVSRKIDVKKIIFQNISQLVRDEGGWDDKAAVLGSFRLIAQNLMMGDKWYFIHPQTARMMMGKLVFEYREEFEKAWSSFKIHILDDANRTATRSIGGVKSVKEILQRSSPPRAVGGDTQAGRHPGAGEDKKDKRDKKEDIGKHNKNRFRTKY